MKCQKLETTKYVNNTLQMDNNELSRVNMYTISVVKIIKE